MRHYSTGQKTARIDPLIAHHVTISSTAMVMLLLVHSCIIVVY